MTKTALAEFYENSIGQSVLNNTPVHRCVSDIKQPKLSWTCRVKRKVWDCENGMIIENVSGNTYGISIRKFYVYACQSDFCRGALCCEASNLHKAKLAAENYKKQIEE